MHTSSPQRNVGILTYIREGLQAIAMRQKWRSGGSACVDIGFCRDNHEAMSEMTREEVDAKLAAVEARIETRMANLEMVVKIGFAELRAEMQRNNANLIKWGVGLAVAIVGLNFGLLTLVMKIH
jgi:hypothetical protein